MTHARALALSVAVMTATGAAQAATPPTLESLFPHQAEVVVEGAGLSRLELPAEVLARCRADLSDLRLFDARERELPYLLLPSEADAGLPEILRRATPPVRDAERREERSRHAPTRYLERFILEVPAPPADPGRWELVLEVARPEFVARLDLAAVTPDGGRTSILEAGPCFRLRQPAAERLRHPLPAGTATLEVVLTSQSGAFLAPAFHLEAVRQGALAGVSEVPLATLETLFESGRSELVVERPRGLLATTLRLSTATGAFHRRVTVWDEGPGAAAEPLGGAQILRIDAVAPVEVLEVALSDARGDRLRLVVDDGDSPPLEGLAVTALVRRPVLFFSLPEGAGPAVLRFGGARAHRPVYDLQALTPVLGDRALTGEAAARAAPFLDPRLSRPATLGPIRDNPAWDPQPALAFAMAAGAPLDPAPFSHRRRLTVSPSAEGLSRLVLEPDDLTLLRPDLADLRVVDDERRQWAYLLELRAGAAVVAAERVGHRVADGRSRYELRPPVDPLVVEGLRLEVGQPFFDRAFRVLGATPQQRELELAAGRLVRLQGDPRPPVVGLTRERISRLWLEVSDGDDAPLDVLSVELVTDAAELYLAAPAGELELLLSDPTAAAPRYELARVRGTVLALPSAPVTAGPLEPNPVFSAAARLARGEGLERLLLWLALGVAVALLGLVTLRLARQSAG